MRAIAGGVGGGEIGAIAGAAFSLNLDHTDRETRFAEVPGVKEPSTPTILSATACSHLATKTQSHQAFSVRRDGSTACMAIERPDTKTFAT